MTRRERRKRKSERERVIDTNRYDKEREERGIV